MSIRAAPICQPGIAADAEAAATTDTATAITIPKAGLHPTVETTPRVVRGQSGG